MQQAPSIEQALALLRLRALPGCQPWAVRCQRHAVHTAPGQEQAAARPGSDIGSIGSMGSMDHETGGNQPSTPAYSVSDAEQQATQHHAVPPAATSQGLQLHRLRRASDRVTRQTAGDAPWQQRRALPGRQLDAGPSRRPLPRDLPLPQPTPIQRVKYLMEDWSLWKGGTPSGLQSTERGAVGPASRSGVAQAPAAQENAVVPDAADTKPGQAAASPQREEAESGAVGVDSSVQLAGTPAETQELAGADSPIVPRPAADQLSSAVVRTEAGTQQSLPAGDAEMFSTTPAPSSLESRVDTTSIGAQPQQRGPEVPAPCLPPPGQPQLANTSPAKPQSPPRRKPASAPWEEHRPPHGRLAVVQWAVQAWHRAAAGVSDVSLQMWKANAAAQQAARQILEPRVTAAEQWRQATAVRLAAWWTGLRRPSLPPHSSTSPVEAPQPRASEYQEASTPLTPPHGRSVAVQPPPLPIRDLSHPQPPPTPARLPQAAEPAPQLPERDVTHGSAAVTATSFRQRALHEAPAVVAPAARDRIRAWADRWGSATGDAPGPVMKQRTVVAKARHVLTPRAVAMDEHPGTTAATSRAPAPAGSFSSRLRGPGGKVTPLRPLPSVTERAAAAVRVDPAIRPDGAAAGHPAAEDTAPAAQATSVLGVVPSQPQDTAAPTEYLTQVVQREVAPSPVVQPSQEDWAQARRQELDTQAEALAQELEELQAQLSGLASSMPRTSTPVDSAMPLGISLDTPVWRTSKRVMAVRQELLALQRELATIEDGTWRPPGVEREPASTPVQEWSRRPAPPLHAEVTEALDDLLAALAPTSGTGSGLRRPTATAFSSQRPGWASSQQGQAQATGFTVASQQTDAQPPGVDVAGWVDDLRDVLGPAFGATAQPDGQGELKVSESHGASREEVEEEERGRQAAASDAAPLEIPPGCSVRALAGLLSVAPARLEAWLRDTLQEAPASLEDAVSAEAAELAALEWGRVPIMDAWAGLGSGLAPMPRPPVVTIMGHVDHGKTSLLDALRNSDVAANEAGGITQHVGAFEVSLPGAPLPITFLDTPGHAAFSAMRARGAAVTDVVVLVVAADDGVMPQTREALAHARSAGCPIVVALTKCDLPDARPDAVIAALASEGLELEEYGGSVQVVHTSARTRAGLLDLQEALLLQAELMELSSPPDGPAVAVVVEASPGKSGPQATVVVKQGRLRVGDPCVVGTQFGKVRALRTSLGSPVGAEGVGPGQHALVVGLRGLPAPGDTLQVVGSEERARRISSARSARADDYHRAQLAAALANQRRKEAQQVSERAAARRLAREARMSALARRRHETAQQLAAVAAQMRTAGGMAVSNAKDSRAPDAATSVLEPSADADTEVAPNPAEVQELRLVLKADVQGSVEAVRALTQQLSTPHVHIKVLHAGVGPVTPGDVNLAIAANAHLVAFNLGPGGIARGGGAGGTGLDAALAAAKQAGVQLLSHNIIYHLVDELRALVEGSTPYVEVEQVVGSGEVLASFPLSSSSSARKARGELPPQGGRIAGLRINDGTFGQGALVRVVRAGSVLYQGRVTSLKRHKLDVEQVSSGTECGLVLDDGLWSDWQPGDVIECVAHVRQRAGSGAGGGPAAAESQLRQATAHY